MSSGLTGYDYSSVITGNMTLTTNDVYYEEEIELPQAPRPGLIPCLVGVECYFSKSVTAGSDVTDDFHQVRLATKSNGALADPDDSEVIAAFGRRTRIVGAVVGIDQIKEEIVYAPPAPVPITNSRIYVEGQSGIAANVLYWRIHLVWRFIKGLRQSRNTFVGQF